MQDPKRKLTKRQYEAYLFISSFIRSNGYSPTCREVADGLCISLWPAQRHINNLYRKNYIRKIPYKERGIVLCDV